MFVYEPSLLMIGDWATIATSSVSAIVGSMCLAAGLMGYLRAPCAWWERVLLLVAAILLIKPGLATDAVGLVCLAIVLVSQELATRRARRTG